MSVLTSQGIQQDVKILESWDETALSGQSKWAIEIIKQHIKIVPLLYRMKYYHDAWNLCA